MGDAPDAGLVGVTEPAKIARERPRTYDKIAGWHPALVLVLAACGFAMGVVLLLAGWNSTAKSEHFVHSFGFAVWATVIGAQTSYWAVVGWPLWQDVRAAYRAAVPARSIWVIPGLMMLVLVLLPIFSGARSLPWPLVGHQVKAGILTVVGGAVVGVPALFGLAITQARMRASDEPVSPPMPAIQLALTARADVTRYLSIAGSAIGLAVLASGALRASTVPDYLSEDDFPSGAPLLYGAFFSGLLLVVYVPTYLSLKSLCQRIRDDHFPLFNVPSPTSEAFRVWVDGRARLETLLQMNVTVTQHLQTNLFIFAPLLSGILGTLVTRGD